MVSLNKQTINGKTYMRKVPMPETSQKKSVIRRQWSTKMLDIKEDMEA